MKALLSMIFLCLFASQSWAILKHRQYAYEVRDEIIEGRLAEKTNRTLDHMIATAYNKLIETGHQEFAEELKDEWQNKYFGYLMHTRDIGDHDPLFEWLDKAYKKLEELLGPEIMEMTRLVDIKTVNYALPVVFRCSIAFDEKDYLQHFVPLTGVITYWSTMVACVVLSSGIMTFFCSPIAMLAEKFMEDVIAPDMGAWVYKKFCSDEMPPLHVEGPSLLWDTN